MYAVGGVCVALAALHHPLWLLALPLGLLLRAHRSIRLRRPWLKLARPVGPMAYLAVAGFVFWIDLAMFAGLAGFLFRKGRRVGV
jgi:hypothetical protein